MAKNTAVTDATDKEKMTDLEDEKSADQKNGWKYSSESSEDSGLNKADDSFDDINWSASEYIAHEKKITWYLALVLITGVISAGFYLLSHSVLSTLVIVVAGGVLGFYAARKPRLLNYKIDNSGFTVQDKTFSYDSFKSFAVIDEDAMPNIVLIPLKRFMPSLTIYLDPASTEAVLKVLSTRLPQDIHHTDIVDRFFQRVRF
jgi:hypothetical protein